MIWCIGRQKYIQPLVVKYLLWVDAGDVAVALAALDAMAVLYVTDVVGADMTLVADTGAEAMTVADVVTAYQAQPPSDPKTALTKTPLNA